MANSYSAVKTLEIANKNYVVHQPPRLQQQQPPPQHQPPQQQQQQDDKRKNHQMPANNKFDNNSNEEKLQDQSENLDNNPSTSKTATRAKTPMCLVNDLARFNKISFQYRLTGENGPAHCKRFTVALKLGDEEYTAEGCKVKEAQHIAAKEAIEKTKYKHPIPKSIRRSDNQGGVKGTNITPTVELNALAMKLGQQTYYIFDPRQANTAENMVPQGGNSMPQELHHPQHLPPRSTVLHGGNLGGGTFVPNLGHNGMHNTGVHNAGAHNTGIHNTGIHNTAHHNAGVRNNGVHNAGVHNTGIHNTGIHNTGIHNTGIHNTGIHNPGIHNTGPHNAAIHNTVAHNAGIHKPMQKPYHNQHHQHLQQQQWPYMPNSQHGFPTYKHNLPNVIIPTSNPMASAYFPSTAPGKITLIVGTQKFVGVGRTLQQAKHDAAAKALQVLKEQLSAQTNKVNEESPDGENDETNDNTSPISLVFEIGLKRKMDVEFKVLREEGPAHMRTFTTACIVGDIVTEGKGTGKKLSKHKAAQQMLKELKKLPPLTPPIVSPLKRVKIKTNAKKGLQNSSKDKEAADQGRPVYKKKNQRADLDSINPITKLIEWHQQNKLREPEFKVISEFGKENSRRKEFVMEVTSNNIVARGVGSNKKLAKLDAAQNFLLAIKGEQPEMNTKSSSSTANRKENETHAQEAVTKSIITPKKPNNAGNFNESQKLPTPPACNTTFKRPEPINTEQQKAIEEPIPEKSNNAPIANEKPSTSNSEQLTTENTLKVAAAPPAPPTKTPILAKKAQLMYLANLMGFSVDFSDYPKGNHTEFLTIVMLSTNPPQICHGVGVDANESQENAASNALKILSEMGLYGKC